MKFNGLDVNLGNLARLSDAKSRSISEENRTGEKGRGGMAPAWDKGAARDLGQGWKCAPCGVLKPHSTFTVADIAGPGAITHIWFTCHPDMWRQYILRMYWDGEATPSVEVPIADFFCNGWDKRQNVTSLPIQVNPAGGFNCFFQLPFRTSAKITVENISETENVLFYQVDYIETEIPDDYAYFHAQFRRVNPVPYKEVYTIVDDVRGKGHYVGTVMNVQPNDNGWWGEGEIKFYLDGDDAFPTICGTGTEDYFGGAWNWDMDDAYTPYSNLTMGMLLRDTDKLYNACQRFTMYRWHISDAVRFDTDLKVTIQMLGWRHDGRYLPLKSDVSSVAFWYQQEPHNPFPALPDRDSLENS